MSTFQLKHLKDFLRSLLLCVSVVLSNQGCMTSLMRQTNPEIQTMLDVNVKKIDSLSTKSLSQEEPVSVEEASKKFREQTIKRETPKTSLPLSIADVRAAALANNLDLKVELVNPSLAKESWIIERAKFDTAFYGNIQYNDLLSPTASELQGSQSNMMQYNIGIRQPLPTGGEIDINHPGSRLETDNQFSTLNPSYTSDLQFSISQPLLRGAGLNSNTHSIRVARLKQKAVDAQTKLEAIRILANADKAYWRVFAASEALFVSQQQYQLANQQLKEARLKVKAGTTPRVEITRAQSGLASRRENIIVALTNLRIAERELKRIMNRPDLPMDSGCALILTTPPSPIGLKLEPSHLAQFAVENRMEMLELELQLAADTSSIDFAKNQRLPEFILDYSYNIDGLGKSFGDSYHQMWGADFGSWSIGVRGEIPLGNRVANAKLHTALLNRVQHLATKVQRKQAIEQETFDAVDQFNQNWQRILAARQEVIFSTRTFEAERKQFELGIRTSTDVLYAAGQLANAQLREILALTDYQISQIDIAFATGTLLGESNVEWQAENM